MFRIVCKSIESFATTSRPHMFFIRTLSSSPTNATNSISKPVNQESFNVQYFMNEFGFSLEKAVCSSRRCHFENRDKPDAVVSFFKNQGFNETQIRKIISASSSILNLKPENKLLKKIEFFRSKGLSSTELTMMMAFNTQLLTRSLEHHIIPSFNSLRELLGSDELVILGLKANSKLLTEVERYVKPNFEVLHKAGVPFSSIAYLLKTKTSMFVQRSDRLKESIEKVLKLGMDPQSSTYGVAVSILTVTRRSKWNEKIQAYKKWGCSEDQVLKSFKVAPWIMSVSEEKTNRVMSLCVNEMGWEPSEVVRRYYVLMYSFNKRIMPRWIVYQELLSRGLVKGEGNIRNMFNLKEDLFLKKYVNFYKNEAPLLLKLYLDKLDASK